MTITVTAVNDAPVAVDDATRRPRRHAADVAAPGVLANDTDVDDGTTLTAALVASRGERHADARTRTAASPTRRTRTSTAATASPTGRTTARRTRTSRRSRSRSPPSTTRRSRSTTRLHDDGRHALTSGAGRAGQRHRRRTATPLTAALVASPANGTLTLTPTAASPTRRTPNFNGSDSFTYRASDGTADSNIATVTITVGAVNDAPVAVNDALRDDEDTPLTSAAQACSANDSDVGRGTTLTAILVASPANGTLTLNPNGAFTYTPNANFNGTTASPTRPATARRLERRDGDDHGHRRQRRAGRGQRQRRRPTKTRRRSAANVLANDTDVDAGTTLTAVLVADGPNGTLTLNANGAFTYTPNANFNGTDSFTYTASDGTADLEHRDGDDHGRRGQRCAGGGRRRYRDDGRHAADRRGARRAGQRHRCRRRTR